MNQIETQQCECIECVGAGCPCGCQTSASERRIGSTCTCGCRNGKPCGCDASQQ